MAKENEEPTKNLVDNPEVGDKNRPAGKKGLLYGLFHPKPGKKEPKQTESRFDKK
ncbi:MAG: hypothetical protein ABSG17_11315 [Spirochaetia bacterium]|jgi:hypothetical protein